MDLDTVLCLDVTGKLELVHPFLQTFDVPNLPDFFLSTLLYVLLYGCWFLVPWFMLLDFVTDSITTSYMATESILKS